jgi:hypothetical protein
MGCPACGPATGAEWAQKRRKDVVAEKARLFREALSGGPLTRAAWRAGLIWVAHVLFEFPEAPRGLSEDRPQADP